MPYPTSNYAVANIADAIFNDVADNIPDAISIDAVDHIADTISNDTGSYVADIISDDTLHDFADAISNVIAVTVADDSNAFTHGTIVASPSSTSPAQSSEDAVVDVSDAVPVDAVADASDAIFDHTIGDGSGFIAIIICLACRGGLLTGPARPPSLAEGSLASPVGQLLASMATFKTLSFHPSLYNA